MKLIQEWSLPVSNRLGQCRAARIRLGDDLGWGILAAWSADFDVDPYIEMFFLPTDTLKVGVFTADGHLLWKRDLGRGVIPGLWFCPVLPFDLDGDGVDEVYLVENSEVNHPLSLKGAVLRRIEASSGRLTGEWPWIHRQREDLGAQFMGMLFRNFLAGGYVDGHPVLVTANGTYGDMLLQGYKSGMTKSWERFIAKEDAGARGSHFCPTVDLVQSGEEHLLWGERALSLKTGEERFCADRDSYRGHSDIIAPCWMEARSEWNIFACRESDPQSAPRVNIYDSRGHRIWGALDRGHMDMGWCARLGPDRRPIVNAIRIGRKTCGVDGRFHENPEEFTFDAESGDGITLPFSTYRTLPVDLNGDGSHEFVRGLPGGNGEILDGSGATFGTTGGPVALACHLGVWPAEQVLTYTPDGSLRLFRDAEAKDSDAARRRYANKFYASAARSSAVGYQLALLGGL